MCLASLGTALNRDGFSGDSPRNPSRFINPFKCRIDELPTRLDNDWRTSLGQFQFGGSKTGLPGKLRQFIDLAFGLAESEEEGHAVLSYAMQIVNRAIVPIMDDRLFAVWVDILCATILAEPSSLSYAYSGIAKGQEFGLKVPTSNLAETLNLLLTEHAQFDRSHEVSWSLATAIRSGINIELAAAKQVAMMSDNASLILLQQLKRFGLISGVKQLDLTDVTDRASDRSALFSPDWLLAYESAAQGWTTGWHVRRTKFYKQMLASNVEFFDPTRLTAVNRTSRAPVSIEELFDPKFGLWFSQLRMGITY